MKFLDDKVSVVTGAATGIGRAIAERLAKEGGKVVIADIDKKRADDTARNFVEQEYDVIAVQTDVANESSVQELMKKCVSHYGRLNFLVNNAAEFLYKGVEEASTSDWQQILGVNVIGYSLCSKYAVPHIRKNSGGSIINISSISALVSQPSFVTYSASKGAIISMTQCMARDLAKEGIRVNTISPGVVLTENAIEAISEKYSVTTADQMDEDPRLGGLHLLSRCGLPKEIANVVAFLLSDEASFITGQNIIVDGGLTIKGPFQK